MVLFLFCGLISFYFLIIYAMKKNALLKWVYILGAVLLLANVILPWVVAYAEEPAIEEPKEENPANPDTPAPESNPTTPDALTNGTTNEWETGNDGNWDTSVVPAAAPETQGETPANPETPALDKATANPEIQSEEWQPEISKASSSDDLTISSDENTCTDDRVACIGTTWYDSLENAFAWAKDWDTITLKADCKWNWIIAPQWKFNNTGLIIDFWWYTYTISWNPVWSAGTESNWFQLLKDNKITFKNWILSWSSRDNPRDNKYFQRMIQNYSNLTLENMEIVFIWQYYNQYTISHCNDDLIIINSTVNAPDFSWANLTSSSVWGAALSVWTFSTYPNAKATIDWNSFINWDLVVDPDKNDTTELNIASWIIDWKIINENSDIEKTIKVSWWTFSDTVPSEYLAEGANISVVDAEAKIGNIEYKTLTDALKAVPLNSGNSTTIYLLKDVDNWWGLYFWPANSNLWYNEVQNPKNVIIDFWWHTYDASKWVWSVWYYSQAAHFEKWSTVVLSWWTITSTEPISMLVQNYSNLTLNNMILDGSRLSYNGTKYSLSNNFWNIHIKGNTKIIPSETNWVLFDLWYWMNGSWLYDEWVTVTFDEDFVWEVSGIVEYWAANRAKDMQWTWKTLLDIKSLWSKFDIKFKSWNPNTIWDLIESWANIQLPEWYSLYKLDDTYFTIWWYTITFDTDGWSAIDPITWAYGQTVPTVANPTKECNSFAGWDKEVPTTMPAENITLKATWNYTCSRSSWGGGGSSRSSSNNTMNEVVLWWEVEVATGDKAEVNTGDENKVDENKSDENIAPQAPTASDVEKYGQELVDAYIWARNNGITTMPTIEQARLKDWITRAELSKMMVVFMSEVLKKQPVLSGNADYADVDNSLGDLADYIQKAYQYQIMWINADGTPIKNFNPNGKVSRAEFATVLSRVLFGSKYNQDGANYYEWHIKALAESKILTNTDPKIQELRWWIILMLYRSQNSETNNVEENTAQVTTWDVAEVESGSAAEVATWTTAEVATGAVVEAATGATAETAIAEANTWDVAKVESGSTAEIATWDSK